MMTNSTARYHAKQLYSLAVMNGVYTTKHGVITTHPGGWVAAINNEWRVWMRDNGAVIRAEKCIHRSMKGGK